MEMNDARTEAENLLHKILTTQPNLLVSEHGHGRTSGRLIANFCSEFIENYSTYLTTREQSGR